MRIRIAVVAMLLLAFGSRAQSVNWVTEGTPSGMARFRVCGNYVTAQLIEVFANWEVKEGVLGTVEKIEKTGGLITVTITNLNNQSRIYVGLGAVTVLLHEQVRVGDKIGDLPKGSQEYFVGIRYPTSKTFIDPRPWLPQIRPYCEK